MFSTADYLFFNNKNHYHVHWISINSFDTSIKSPRTASSYLNNLMVESINLTTITASIAILLNVFLIFLIVFIRNSQLGNFKWALVLLAGFETVFAIDLVLAPPYFVVMNGTWMAFSFGTVISDSIMSYFASLVYCSLHQIWVGIISALFIYRYMVICR